MVTSQCIENNSDPENKKQYKAGKRAGKNIGGKTES